MSDVLGIVTATIYLDKESLSQEEKTLIEKAIRRTLEAQLISYAAVTVE
jgi:hypothetical protein